MEYWEHQNTREPWNAGRLELNRRNTKTLEHSKMEEWNIGTEEHKRSEHWNTEHLNI